MMKKPTFVLLWVVIGAAVVAGGPGTELADRATVQKNLQRLRENHIICLEDFASRRVAVLSLLGGAREGGDEVLVGRAFSACQDIIFGAPEGALPYRNDGEMLDAMLACFLDRQAENGEKDVYDLITTVFPRRLVKAKGKTIQQTLAEGRTPFQYLLYLKVKDGPGPVKRWETDPENADVEMGDIINARAGDRKAERKLLRAIDKAFREDVRETWLFEYVHYADTPAVRARLARYLGGNARWRSDPDHVIADTKADTACYSLLEMLQASDDEGTIVKLLAAKTAEDRKKVVRAWARRVTGRAVKGQE